MFKPGSLSRRSIPGILLAWFFAVQFLNPCSAAAQNLFLTNFALHQQSGNLLLQFSLHLDDMVNVEKLLLDGATLVLECQADLSSKNSYWFDDDLAQKVMQSGVKSDSLTREFLVSLPDRERPIKHKRLNEAIQEAWGRLVMDIGPVDKLTRGQEYNVSLQVRLKYADVPPWLKQTLFFWSWDVMPSTSYEMDFVY